MYKKNRKFVEQESDYDFLTTSDKPFPKMLPITKYDAGLLETKEQKFERYLRQLSRCIYACSLCELGDIEVFGNNTYYDPHCSNPIKFNKIMFLKYTPNNRDIEFGIFNEFKEKCEKYGLKFDNIYKTSIIKCCGESKFKCPYFDIELKSSRSLFKLIIIFDKKSASYLGLNFKDGELDIFDNSRVYYCNNNLDNILKLIKLSNTNQQIYNSLFV